jgi:putative DNA primase/helicase
LTRGAYFAIGKPGDVICIAEGFATAATIHAATGHAVAVAFYCANLAPVSGALRAKFPAARLVVCADDDRGTEGNPGVSSAIAAAKAIGGFVALPDFGPDRPDGATDFNDLARLRGADAVRQSIEAADMGVPAATSIAEPEVVLVSAEAVKPEPIQWLWRDWLAAGKLHVVAGAPGTGKTTIALALGASITSGGLWPDGSKAPIGSVLMWSSEDGFADTIIPRLMAAGADRSRFHFIDGVKDADGTRPFDPAHDVPVLRRALARVTTPRLLIVDPIVSAVAGDGHKSNDVRRGLQPLVNLAAEYGCAVIGVTHHSKNTKGADPLERVTGSIAYGALARLVFAAAKMADGADGPGRIFARAKSNIGPDGGGYRYSLVETEVVTDQPIRTSRVEWGEAVDGTARDLLAEAETAGEDTADERKDAVRWLHDLLASGPLAADEVQRLAEHDGLKWRTVQRAKVKAGAVSERDGFGPGAKYVWRLAMPATESPCVPCAPSFEAGTHGKHGQSAPESTPGREVF